MVLLFVVSEQIELPRLAPGWDKLLHAGAYGTLGALSLRGFHGGITRLRKLPTILGFLLTVAYGMVDEWHQAWVPGRHPSVYDWLADLVGALCAVGVVGSIGALYSPPGKPGSPEGRG